MTTPALYRARLFGAACEPAGTTAERSTAHHFVGASVVSARSASSHDPRCHGTARWCCKAPLSDNPGGGVVESLRKETYGRPPGMFRYTTRACREVPWQAAAARLSSRDISRNARACAPAERYAHRLETSYAMGLLLRDRCRSGAVNVVFACGLHVLFVI